MKLYDLLGPYLQHPTPAFRLSALKAVNAQVLTLLIESELELDLKVNIEIEIN